MTEARVPARVRRVSSEDQARELAAALQRPGRDRPVVVISTPAGHDTPFVDPQRVLDDVDGLAEVVVIPTGDVSWAFSSGMPPDTQVYGGASRVYGTDLEWVHQPRRSPLHFAYSPDEDARVHDRLVGDVMRFAVRAGIVGSARSAPDATPVEGTVLGLLGSRALVSTDGGGQASIAEELVLPDVPLSRVLAPGMRVAGVLDPVRRLLDVRGMLPDAAALRRAVHAAYRVGQVVLGRVETVEDHAVRIALAPGVLVRVRRAEITGNDLDLLGDLFTPGEVVVARRVPAPLDGLALRLDDVDESEDKPVTAIALLEGGPPWLEPDPPARDDEPLAVLPAPVVDPAPDGFAGAATDRDGPPTPADLFGPAPGPGRGGAPPGPPAPEAGGPRAPTPGDVAAWHAGGQDTLPSPPPSSTVPALASDSPAEPPGKAARDLSLSLDAARAKAAALAKELLDDKVKRHQVELEVDRLLGRVGELTERLERAERRAEQQATALRKARQEAARLRRRLGDAGDEPPEERHFLDDEEQLRFEVLTEWARTIPAADKATRPLAPYRLGPRFLAALADVEGVSRERVVWTVVMVLTGLAPEMNGLQVHRLRTGSGGDDPARQRDDGAQCWRVALQVNSPSARRLHYWRLPGGAFELSRVVLHDDVEP
ncbi:hypothetical protein ACFQHV_10805 [Promicromonospora thailandica]|uniref:S1 motif domain-containing protein n=1 Tax=Promicromonospora thailandica TaxID=765201 RepID=A0A9X2GAK8_9MICO|nr:hypothetical protein [Promicromonospora thailandica]MCP2264966.1 hypothetical protein [Promicromonospora thailandica]BFF18755.1 hypothetical protein GCM10025730_22760 [Promicromonospora thailandica]